MPLVSMTLHVNDSSKDPARIASLKIDKNVYTTFISHNSGGCASTFLVGSILQ